MFVRSVGRSVGRSAVWRWSPSWQTDKQKYGLNIEREDSVEGEMRRAVKRKEQSTGHRHRHCIVQRLANQFQPWRGGGLGRAGGMVQWDISEMI